MSRKYLQYGQHAQFLCTPSEYPPLLQAWWYRHITGEGYLAVSPRYLISRCPLCGAEHWAKADTHSIISWNMPTVDRDNPLGVQKLKKSTARILYAFKNSSTWKGLFLPKLIRLKFNCIVPLSCRFICRIPQPQLL